ncbi:hypothetical protein [Treponema bryantii]|uniref:hypothetical protein n=1 Tax=Treponema bryantii TaxID=163 RepID=UPI0003B619FC|nr:hypothetical protein [Treponema bryantii]
MKKLLFTIVLFSSLAVLSFAAPKKEKADEKKTNYVKLDPKKKFAIEGVELGSLEWCQDDAKLTAKGELIWNKDKSDDWLHFGWDLRGTDLSQYGALRIEIASFTDREDLRVEMANPASLGDATFAFEKDGICYVFFDGSGRWYGDMKNPDPEEGYEIRFLAKKANMPKTVIKSIELINKEDIPDASDLELMGVPFGSQSWQTHIMGKEITWLKGEIDGNAGWNFTEVDLSEYDRIRVELESNDATNIELSLNSKDWKNYHTFYELEQNVLEADLTGEGAGYKNDDSLPLDKSDGLYVYIHQYNGGKPRTKDMHTVVKSVQLLKGKRQINENLKLLGSDFGSSRGSAYISDGGKVEWILPKKDWDACAGWNVRGIDFTGYEKIRIELDPESAKLPYEIRMTQDDCHIGYNFTSPTVIEANLDGSGYSWSWPDGAKWDSSKGINEIQIRLWWQKSGVENQKSIVKSVTLVKAGEGPQLPDRLLLNGAKLGSRKWPSTSWLDDDYAINWAKEKYEEFGWRVEKLEGDILEVKVTSTDVPLNLKIRDNKKNEAEWTDDGSHIFRIDLKTKKMLRANGSKKEPNWTSQTKKFDFSEGGEVLLLPTNGVFKEGKKTVIEYVKVE